MAVTTLLMPGRWQPIGDTGFWACIKADPLNDGRPVPITLHADPLRVLVDAVTPGVQLSYGPPSICDEHI